MATASKTSAAPKPNRAPTLWVIVSIKLLKGVLVLLLALGVYSLTDNNLPADFRHLLNLLHLDPERKFFVDLARFVGRITPTNLAWVAAGSVVYSVFMFLQAAGLAFRFRWAVWLVIGESAFFVPVEVMELLPHPSYWLFFVLAINIFIVWYLFANRVRIVRHHNSKNS
jgi:uncharacterized membrane protein (DUF2068 family)